MVTTWSEADEAQRSGVSGHQPASPVDGAVTRAGCAHLRSAGAVAGELALAIVVAVAVSMVVQWAVGRVHIPFPSNAGTALATLGSATVLLGLAVLIGLGRS